MVRFFRSSDFLILGSLEDVPKLKCTKKCMRVGSFSFELEYTPENYAMCAVDNVMEVTDTKLDILVFQGIIETRSLNRITNIISVSGVSTEAILDWKPPLRTTYRAWDNKSVLKGYRRVAYDGSAYKDVWTLGPTIYQFPLQPGETYRNIGEFLDAFTEFMHIRYGSTYDLIVYNAPVAIVSEYTVFDYKNKSLLDILRDMMFKLHPDKYFTVRFFTENESSFKGTPYIQFIDRGSYTLRADDPSVSNIVYTETAKGEVDEVFVDNDTHTEWNGYSAVRGNFVPNDKPKWFLRGKHTSNEGEYGEESGESSVNLESSAWASLVAPKSSYEFVVDSTASYSLGGVINYSDPEIGLSLTRYCNEIEYVFIGSEYSKIYAMSDLEGGN